MRYLPILFAVFLIFSCDKEQEYDKKKAVSAFAAIDPIRVDKFLEKVEIKLPPQKNNNFWSGSASAQNQEIENFEKKFSFKTTIFGKKTKEISLTKSSQIWFFYSGGQNDHFVFSPIIKDEKIYLLDTSGVLIAHDLKTEKKIWKTRVFARQVLKNYKTPKISYFDGKIFAIAGVNKIAAINAAD
jgi:outer membrane protein assembly factor BamB